MKIYRGGATTDEKPVTWEPDRHLWFDATIDKSGERHTHIGVQIDEKDILALQAGLQKYYRACVKERDELRGTVLEFESVLDKISSLLSWHREDAPDHESFLSALKEIADHFRWNRDQPFKSEHRWLKWKDL